MKRIGRNDPCPCGSGKKFKGCCIERTNGSVQEEFSNPINYRETYKKIKKESRIKQCLHPDKNACSEKIINAHSIQNNKMLKNIASNGVVYMPCPKADNPFAVMTKYGRKEASVFTGFCGYHDNKLFQPIEDNGFNKSAEHIFLYTYRCFAIEFHKKQEVSKMGQLIYAKRPSLLKVPSEDNPFGGINMALNDFEPVKRQFDQALLSEDYDIITSVIWEFDQPLNFAATGFEAMSHDLEGNEIQDLSRLDILMKHVFVVVFSEREKSYCIISWLKENDELFSDFYKQMNVTTEQQKKNYINNLLPMISENIAINPDAWDKWDESKKSEFGSLIWGMESIAELSGVVWDRLGPPVYDLFDI
ncbi:YecA family protein [Pontibacillus litoralis]|uniref:Uncharacterized protein n=1 Tax=Pontibacillus litoralis JSM 072002 TaxID=1385512 RepID=A0A0A5FYJ3_9BACI|nr:SEC-C metal-binding domain-containing protein [Pontibacillus litoralis]KGX85886.1 hypothetical protein N784_06695 [Pontibacillus litoralis JSM 072002]